MTNQSAAATPTDSPATTEKTVKVAVWRYRDPNGDWRFAYFGDVIEVTIDEELQRATEAGVFDQPPPGPRLTPFIATGVDPDQLDDGEGYWAGIWSPKIAAYFDSRDRRGPTTSSSDGLFNGMAIEPPSGRQIRPGIDTPTDASPLSGSSAPSQTWIPEPPPAQPEPSATTDQPDDADAAADLQAQREHLRNGRLNDCLAAINELGLPRAYGAPKIREALRSAGHVFANDVIAAAVRARKLPAEPTP